MDSAEQALVDWYESHRPADGRDPERYVVCAGLAVTEHARSVFPLVLSAFVTDRNQVRTGGPFIQRILERYGEKRPYTREGGRTTRGTVPAAIGLADRLNQAPDLHAADHEERIRILDSLQLWLVRRATEYFSQQRVPVELDSTAPGALAVSQLLDSAGNKTGAVAQHLVGAKLALRFREQDVSVENFSYTTADAQLGRPGDFVVGSTVFHVTVAPTPEVVEKCRRNIKNGYRAHLLVRESVLQAARQLVVLAGLDQQVAVSAIESFIGQNVEEMSRFDQTSIVRTLSELFAEYNRRVAEIETDRSLLLDIPEFLR